jgi:hypothetical protein
MPSEAVDVDVGQRDGRRLKNCPVVVDLDALGPVGRGIAPLADMPDGDRRAYESVG